MIPKIYDKNESYIGLLPDATRGIVIEERNGMFEAELEYQLFSPNWDKLVRGNIIVVHANDTLLNQKFRIYKIGKTIRGKFTVFAKHISYDMQRDMIEGLDISNQSCEYCLNMIFRNSQFSQKFKGYSNIINAQNFKIGPTKLLSAIGGTEGSIIDTFGTGAELLRDNENIHVLNKRGNDNGVIIEYAENLTGLDITEDEDGLITRIRAKAKYTPEGGEETEIFTYVDSSHISDYETPFISEIDFSDKFNDGEIPTVEKLTKLGEAYFRFNKCDIFEGNYKIQFIPLSKCVGYENIEDKISLCDTVTIKDYRYNLDTKAKVIKATYDFLRERYESMEVGQPRTTLGDVVGGSDSNKGEQGPPGPQGPPGKDGDIENFPDTLPSKPVLNSKLYGFASIELSWTYENKVYYNYELYASKTKDFTPNAFDIIHSGQTSSFLFQAKPNETWYFRVCAVNSHGNRSEFSSQIAVTTKKIDDMSNYFEDAAIGRAVVGSLTADYMESGIIKGNWVDAKNLSVTDGNGNRTLDIDTYGNVYLSPSVVKVGFNGISDNFTLDEYGIDWKNAGSSYKNISIKKGSFMFYNWMSGSFLGGISPLLLGGSAKENAGIGIINSNNATFIEFARDDSWLDSSNGSQTPFSAMTINFLDRGEETALLQGIQLFLPMYARNGIDFAQSGDITNLNNLYLNGEIQFPRGFKFIEYAQGISLPEGTLKTIQLDTKYITTSSGPYIYFKKTISPEQGNTYNCGEYNYPWAKVYSSGGVSAGSDRNLKENIKYVKNQDEITYDDMYSFVKDDLELAKFNYKGQDKEEMGFIAQDLLYNLDGTDNKVGQFIINPIPVPTEEEINNIKESLNEGQEYHDPTLQYDMATYINVLAGALKKTIIKVEEQQKQIDQLTTLINKFINKEGDNIG